MQTNQESLKYQCKVDAKSSVLRELTVSVDTKSIQGYIDSSLGRIQKSATLKGFRKGKAPLYLIKKVYMADVKADVVKQVVNDSFWMAVREQNIQPVGWPEISGLTNAGLEDEKELSYTAQVEVFPEIKLSNLSKLKATKYTARVGDVDVDQVIDNLRQSQATVLSSEGDSAYDRPAKEGDTVDMSFVGKLNGEVHDKLKGEHETVKIGAQRFLEKIENALVGMKKGEEKNVTVDFDADFPDQLVAGKPVEFTVTLHEIKKVELPALDEEFLKRYQMESVDQLRDRVRTNLKNERESEAKSKTRESIVQALLDAHSFDVPKSLIENELRALMEDFSMRIKRQGFTDQMVVDELVKRQPELRASAEKRVRAFLILNQVAGDQSIDVSDEQLNKEYETIAKDMNSTLDQVKKFYDGNEDALRQLKYRLKEDAVIDYLLGKMKVEEAKA